MGEAKRITQDVRDAREAARQAGAVAARQDLMRKAIDGMANTVRWRMQTLTVDEMTTVLGTMVGIFAAPRAVRSGPRGSSRRSTGSLGPSSNRRGRRRDALLAAQVDARRLGVCRGGVPHHDEAGTAVVLDPRSRRGAQAVSVVPHRVPPAVVRAFSRSGPWAAREIVTTTTNLSAEERVEVERVLRQDLDTARADLAAAVRAQDPERHFKGLRVSLDVIAAYDAVREAEKAVARLDKEGRRA